MKIYQMLEQCIEQGKKFTCDITPYEECVIQRGEKTGDVYIAYKNTNNYCARFDCSNAFINATYTEYDPTIYMDFISACKLSKEKNVWIKRKDDRLEDAIRSVNDKFEDRVGYDYHMLYEDVISNDWHKCEVK